MSNTDAKSDKRPDALKRAGDAMEANPLAILAGGAAVGLLAGMVLPRTESETALFGTVGRRMTAAAAAAAAAARDTGLAELEAQGISGKAAKAQVNRLFDGVVEAAGTAGHAAAGAAVEKARKPAK